MIANYLQIPHDFRAKLRIAAGLVIGGAAVAAIIGQVDLTRLGAILAAVSPRWIGVALIMLCAGYGLRIIRWWVMLRSLNPDKALHPGRCVAPFMISIALNNILPLRAGDIVRVVAFRAKLNTNAAAMLGTLLVERLLDLCTLMTFFFLLLLTLPSANAGAFIEAARAISAAGAIVVAVAVVAPRPLLFLAEGLIRRFPRLARLLGPALAVFRVMASLCRPASIIPLLGLSVLSWACEGGLFFASAQALGLMIAPTGPLLAMAITTLATVVPSAPGYIGTFHYACMQTLMVFGASAEQGFAVAVLAHLLLWLPTTLVGLSFIAVEHFSQAASSRQRRQQQGSPDAAVAIPMIDGGPRGKPHG